MNRRTALVLSLLSGGLLPAGARALAQDPDDLRAPSATPLRRKKAGANSARPARSLDDEPPAEEADAQGAAADETGPPADVRPEPGYRTQVWNISRYAQIAYTPENPKPEAKIVEWIFRRTGSADWHGPKTAILSASRTQIRAYHSPAMLKKVNDVVRRFTNPAETNWLAFRVRFVRAADTRWRYLVHSRMSTLATGPQGQQVWTLSPTDAQMVLSQMGMYRGFEILVDRKLKVVNGQTFTVEKSEPVEFKGGVQRDGGAGLGAQPAAQQLKEGITLRMSPLLDYAGDALEVALDLQTNIVRRVIKTSILTRREVGPNDLQIEVPEVTETRLDRPIQSWPLGQTLLISGGITPGILEPKNGFLGVPGTRPTDRELLVFLDAETVADAPRAARRGD